jgi:hypothetical protein
MKIKFRALSFGILALVPSVLSAQAKDLNLHCGDPAPISGTGYEATFHKFGNGDLNVSLFVPIGADDGDYYFANCAEIPGTDDPAYQCEVQATSDSSYTVELFSNGAADDWSAFVSPLIWNKRENRIPLTCSVPTFKKPPPP